jgi:hypothetical protein
VLSRASKPSEVLEIALDTRDSRAARRFRAYGARVDAAIAAGNREDVVRACAELSSYGVRLAAELPSSRATRDQAVDAAKELVSIASPLLGAVIPGLALAAGQASTRIRRRKFAFLEQLTRAPRTLNEVEREFARLWPRLLACAGSAEGRLGRADERADGCRHRLSVMTGRPRRRRCRSRRCRPAYLP